MNLKAQRLGIGASTFSLSPFAAVGGKGLGQTEQTLYSRAKSAVLEFEGRATSVPPSAADKTVKDRVAALVARAEAATPTNYGLFSSASVDADVQKLEDINRAMSALAEPSVESVPLQVDSAPRLGGGAVVLGLTVLLTGVLVYSFMKAR